MLIAFVLGVGCAHVFRKLGIYEWLLRLTESDEHDV